MRTTAPGWVTSSSQAGLRVRRGLSLVITLIYTFTTFFVTGVADPALADAGSVTLSDVTAPNLVGDSNVQSQPTQGPDAFVISSRYCNAHSHSIYDFTTNVGEWAGTAATSTAGEFEDTVVPVGLYDYDGTFDLELVPGAGNPETRYLGELAAGECVIINTIVSYEVVDANGEPVYGRNTAADDLAYNFDYWATWVDPGSDGLVGTVDDVVAETNATEFVTVRSEITASANKIETSTVSVSPASTVAIGETVTITFDGVDFGLVNQGFDSDGDGNPDYDLWFQAIGEATLWDPDVFQLVGVDSTLTGACGGSPAVLTATDTTYFTGLDSYGNCSWTGTYAYTFIALSDGTSIVAPYQEVASGSNNEKYNGDYCGDDPASAPVFCATLTASGSNLTLSKSVAAEEANEGDTLTWSITYENTGSNPMGDPGAGYAVYVDDIVPTGTTFSAGSAACGTLACEILYSTDSGATYSVGEPTDPATITNLRWLLDVPVPASATDTVTFQTTVDLGTSGFVNNTAGITIGGEPPPLAQASAQSCIGGCAVLMIDKDTSTPSVSAGGQATYTIVVENLATATGDATSVSVSDVLPSGFTYNSTTSIAYANTDGSDPVRTSTTNPTVGEVAPVWGSWTLDPGDRLTVTFDVDVAGSTTFGVYDNTVDGLQDGETVTDDGLVADDGGFGAGADPESDEDVTVAPDYQPVLTVTKTGSPNPAVVGQAITYTYTVSHHATSDDSAVSGVSIVDSRGLTLTLDSGDTNTNNLLDGGETWTFTGSETVTLATPDPLTNDVTVDGTDLNGEAIPQSTDNESVDIVAAPILAVVKSSDAGASAAVGDTINYSYSVSHDGASDGSPVSSVVVVDDVLGTISGPDSGDDGDGLLEAGETWVYSALTVVAVDGVDPLVNNVTADGTDRDGDPAGQGTDLLSIPIEFAPVLSVTKVADVDPALIGDTVTYTYTVTHDGTSDGSPVSAVTVVDSRGLTLTLDGGDVNTNNLLDGGETWVYTATEIVTVSTPDPLTNTVEVDGTDRDGQAIVQATDSESVDIEHQPVLAIIKTGPAAALADSSVTYDVTVGHDGTSDQSPISSVVVTDPFGTVTYTGGDTNTNNALDFGETWTYTVVGTLPAAPDPYTNTASVEGVDQDADTVGPVTDDHALDVIQPATISDFAFEDVDGDGIYIGGTDQPLSGVTVNLYDSSGTTLLDTATTGADGLYAFTNLVPETYVVEFVAPTTFLLTTADQGADDTMDSDAGPAGAGTGSVTVSVAEGETNNSVDAGFYDPVSISGQVFTDLTEDGTSTGEPAVAGVSVELWEDTNLDGTPDTLVDTVTTNGSGTYTFANVPPGDYAVVVDGTGFTFTTQDVPGDDTIDSDVDAAGTSDLFTVASGDVIDGPDAGYLPATLGNLVWDDVDGDGIKDAGESGVDGVVVNLYDAADLVTPIASVTTSGGGAYEFKVAPGDYVIEVVAPGGSVFATPDQGGDDTLDSDVDQVTGRTSTISVLNGVSDLTIDAALVTPATIGDTVYTDIDGDGIEDGGETGMAGVTVNLIDGGGSIVDTAVTDAGGNYVFSGVAPGTYTVSVDATTVPAGYAGTTTDPLTVVVGSGDTVTTADFGFIPPSSMTVEKTPATQDVPLNGDAVFTITITNSGPTELTNIVITDTLAACDTTSIASLASGFSAAATCTTSGVTADFTNTVDVSATDAIGRNLAETDTADVTVLAPSISIAKGPATQYVVLGGTATFSITVTNTGGLDLTGVTVTDPAAPGCNAVFASIAVGGTETYSCTQDPVIADYTNVASVSASAVVGNVVTDSDSAAVDMIQPDIDIQKTPDLTHARAGDTVTFTIEVSNTGDIDLANVVVSDPLTSSCDATFATLAVGVTETYTCTMTAAADFTNTASVVADEPSGGTVTGTDTADLDVIAPAILITKNPATQEVIVNGTATFTITVENTGDSGLSNVVISDPLAPDCDASFASLASGATETFTCTLSPVTVGFTNTAGVTADDLSGQPVGSTDTADVTVVSGVIDIQKTPNIQTILAGGTATFDITVTNGGTIDLLGVTVSDPLAPDCDNAIGTLAAGASATYSCTLAPVAADFTNTATVAASDAVGNSLTDSDTAAVDVIVPVISVSKTPDIQTITHSGTVTFTIEVTNAGDADLTNLVITDPLATNCDTTFASLAVGAVETYTCTVANVTAGFTNTVGVTADEPSGGSVNATDTADVTVLVPGIEIQKTPDYQVVGLGGTATFGITVTNTGQTDLTGVTVTDLAAPGCDNVIGDLAIGGSVTYSCTVAGVGADFTNTAAVEATDPIGGTWTDSDTADVDLINPGLTVSKTPDLQTLLSGETASFTIAIENTGDVDLTNIVVSDPNAAGCDSTFATITSGSTETVTCTVAGVSADFTNTVTVTADTPLGTTLSVSDDAVVDVVFPGINLQKTPDIQQVLVGDDVTFTIQVTNTGTEDLINVAVTDPLAAACDNAIGPIAAGASVSYDCTVAAVAADFTNIASVTGEDTFGNPVSDSDDAAVDMVNPAVQISKTPDDQTVIYNGTATFSIEVTNTGDVDLTDVTVSDPSAPGCDGFFPTVTPGSTETIGCTVANVTADFINTASVTATDPLGNALPGSDTGDVSVLQPGIEIQKTPDLQQVVEGNTATFTISVTNTGATDLTNVEVADPLVPDCDNVVGSLVIGESVSYTCTASVTTDFTNTAHVSATDPLGGTWTDSDSADVDAIVPAFTVTKSPDVQSVPLGDVATFTIEVANTGDVDLTNIATSDPSTPACDNTIAVLVVGSSAAYTCTAAVTADFTNTVFATGDDPNGDPVDGGSDAADVTALLPGVLVEKVADSTAVGVGQDVIFTITVTNIGDVVLDTVDVVDATYPVCDNTVGPLAPGAFDSYTCAVIDVMVGFTNTVNATAIDGNGNTATSTDSEVITVLPGSIAITKLATSATVVDGGDVTYTITVTNDGPADLLNVAVTDATLPACDAAFAIIPVGAVEIYSCTSAAIDATVIDPVVNVIEVASADEAGTSVVDSATETVDVLVPALSVFKNADSPMIQEGEDATFTITIINTGETALTDVTVSDAAYPSCDSYYATLAVSEVQWYTCTVVGVTADFTNTVEATAIDPIGGTVGDDDSASVVVNHPPVAVDDSETTPQDTPITFDPRVNDADPDGDALTIGSVDTTATLGTVTINLDGTVTYTPPAGFSGTDTFIYSVCDPSGLCDTATVTVVVVANGGITGTVWFDADADGIFDSDEIDLSGVGIDVVCAGPDEVFGTADDVTLPSVTTGSPYTVSDLPPGHCRVSVDTTTLPAGISIATFDVDGGHDSSAVVEIIAGEFTTGIDFGFVDPNAPPVAVDDGGETDEDTPVTIALLPNDSDPEGEPLSVDSITQPSHGSVSLNPDGTVTYTPDTEFSGTDTFTYTVCDTADLCDTATVTVIVHPSNDPPVIETTEITVNIGDEVPLLDSLDPEGHDYRLEVLSGTLPSGLTLNADGTFSGSPAVTALVSLTIEACDELGSCKIYTVILNVLGPVTSGSTQVPVTLVTTGLDSDRLVLVAGLLMVLGASILLLSSRRRRLEVIQRSCPWGPVPLGGRVATVPRSGPTGSQRPGR